MVMKYLSDRARLSRAEKSDEVRPGWASEANSSLAAWRYVEAQRKEKAGYIKSHHKNKDYLTKSHYQIKPSEVARALEINRSTLMHRSSYSNDFSAYLKAVNAELEVAKQERLERGQKSPSRGSIRNSKDELVEANKELKKRIAELEAQKTEELVRQAFDLLPLPVRIKLGID